MAASTGDKVTDTRNATRPNSARVSSGRSAGGATLACDNLTGWPTASKVHFVTYQIDSSSAPVPGSQLDCTGIVSGNNIGSFTVVDGNDTGNSVNDVVEMLPTAAWGQDLADALTAQHTRTGTHKNITNTGGITTDTLSVSGAATLSGGTTLPAGDIGASDIASNAITPSKLATGAAQALVATNENTSSTSYADLATAGPSVTVTIGSNGLALVSVIGWCNNSSASSTTQFMGFAVSGATTVAAADNYSAEYQSFNLGSQARASGTFLVTGLTAGSNTFTAKYKVGSGNANWADRRILVVPL